MGPHFVQVKHFFIVFVTNFWVILRTTSIIASAID